MMRFLLKIITFFLLLYLCDACADPRPLTGGQKDTTPPRLDSVRYSTPNKSIFFKEKMIILSFDEWIKLDKAASEIVISPPLQQKLDIKIKYRSVVIRFKEELRPNSTYTINFGESIRDITENNAAKDMRFVFSTGAFLDSLQVKGQIVDAFTSEPRENVLVMLYTDRQDSIPLKEKPYYFGRTDKQGKFLIENVKSDSFKIFALSDKNSDYLFNQVNEEIGFWKDNFFLTDSTQPTIQMRLYAPTQNFQISSTRVLQYGAIKVAFNRPFDVQPTTRPLNPPSNYKEHIDYYNDSLVLWVEGDFEPQKTYQWLMFNANKNAEDTINAEFQPRSTLSLPSPTLAIAEEENGKKSSKKDLQHPTLPHILNWNQPILLDKIDTNLVSLLDSSQNKISYQLVADSLRPNKIWLYAQWLPKQTYRLLVLPNAITNFWNSQNTDSIKYSIEVGEEESFGTAKIRFANTDSTMLYTMQFVRGTTEVLHTQQFRGSADSIAVSFDKLVPDAYLVRLIHDANNNGRWDTGDYFQKKQPERITNSKPLQIRANWDNEMDIDANPTPKTTVPPNTTNPKTLKDK